MVVKRKKRSAGKRKHDSVKSDLNLFQHEINKNTSDVEKWVIARRKFFIKLLKVALLAFLFYLLVRTL
ncbi:hypothetical protein J4218_06070 [Candidatus Pacearchaeota archaeon]|nr:hypothetical protein [Candidatus Pacearchaeota archaeon]